MADEKMTGSMVVFGTTPEGQKVGFAPAPKEKRQRDRIMVGEYDLVQLERIKDTLSTHGEPVKIAEGLGELIEAAEKALASLEEGIEDGDDVEHEWSIDDRKIVERLRAALSGMGV